MQNVNNKSILNNLLAIDNNLIAFLGYATKELKHKTVRVTLNPLSKTMRYTTLTQKSIKNTSKVVHLDIHASLRYLTKRGI